MPRYRVAENQHQFDVLISLLDFEGEVASRAMEIIRMLATNPVLYERVHSLGEPGFSWSSIFDDTNVHKMLYALEIVESILALDDFNSQENWSWLSRFVTFGGLQEL